ncbi:MAG TPA: PKD domain-containing protein [Candidatus Thermoplasmatota archaeon]|nr:PKD domain-containing protein [Candidatus Thermoplasmatota archaeon]
MRLVLPLLAAALILSGCSSNGGGDGSSGTGTTTAGSTSTTLASTATSGASDAPTTSEAPVDENRAPEASLVASVALGMAPLTVNFTLDGSDPDGDALTWTLDLDGDGAADAEGDTLPAEHEAVFAEPGLFNVTLAVNDDALSANDTLAIEVTAVAAAQDWQAYTGAIEGEAVTCAAGPYDASPVGGFTAIEVVPGSIGKDYTATFRSGAAFDAVVFVDSAGTELARVFVGIHLNNWVATGTVPAGAATVAFVACSNTFAETFNYVAGSPPPEAVPPPL